MGVNGVDILQSFLIIIIFLGLYASIVLYINIQNINNNWTLYRCNPMVMPFAGMFGHNSSDNFTYCIQNMQKSYSSYLMQPMNYNMTLLSSSTDGLTSSLNDMRTQSSTIRNFASSITSAIYGVFLNIIIEFQKIGINLKDMMGKMVGVVVVIMYLMDASIKSMKSIWNGVPGKALNSLCFHPETLLTLKNGSKIFMKDINLGDILENGSTVIATMQIDNPKQNRSPLYIIPSITGNDIYVTGSHMILNPSTKQYISIANYAKAKLSMKQTDWFTCLITDDHLIQIGEHTFWDWEDDLIDKV
jgi:hypothetical protein